MKSKLAERLIGLAIFLGLVIFFLGIIGATLWFAILTFAAITLVTIAVLADEEMEQVNSRISNAHRDEEEYLKAIANLYQYWTITAQLQEDVFLSQLADCDKGTNKKIIQAIGKRKESFKEFVSQLNQNNKKRK